MAEPELPKISERPGRKQFSDDKDYEAAMAAYKTECIKLAAEFLPWQLNTQGTYHLNVIKILKEKSLSALAIQCQDLDLIKGRDIILNVTDEALKKAITDKENGRILDTKEKAVDPKTVNIRGK